VLGYGTDVVQPCMLGFDLYVKKMRERGGMLPLPNGGSVKLNIVYINLAGAGPFMADYSLVLAQYNLPQFIAVSTFPIITPAAPLVVALYKKIVSKDPAVLMANWGITQPFSYIVPTALFTDVPTSYLANLVEDAQSAIIVHPSVCETVGWSFSRRECIFMLTSSLAFRHSLLQLHVLSRAIRLRRSPGEHLPHSGLSLPGVQARSSSRRQEI
jgi:hypothetical protein